MDSERFKICPAKEERDSLKINTRHTLGRRELRARAFERESRQMLQDV